MYGMGMGQPVPYIDPQTGRWVIPPENQGNPQSNQTSENQIQQDDLIRVHGMEGAKAYRMRANSRAALFDDMSDEDIVIIKTTDGAGFASYRRARLDWIEEDPEDEPITRAELNAKFEELKGLILSNGKQSVRKSSKSTAVEEAE